MRTGQNIGRLMRWGRKVADTVIWLIVGYLAGAVLFTIFATGTPRVALSIQNQLSSNAESKGCLTAIDALNLPDVKAGSCVPINLDETAACVVMSGTRVSVFDVGPVFAPSDAAGLHYPAPSTQIPLVNARWPDQAVRGQLHPTLFHTMNARADNAKTRAALYPDAAPFEGRVLFAVDTEVPFETKRQAMYTSGQAQYGHFQFVARDGDALCAISSTLPSIGPPGSTL